MIIPNKNKNNNKGFTLIEMIVSIAIFMIVALVAVGAFLKIIDLNNKSHTLKDSINNINFALDLMSRELRVGSNYYCPDENYVLSANTDLPSPDCMDNTALTAWYIYFYSSEIALRNGNPSTPCKLVYAYRFTNDTIEKAEQKTCNDVINSSSFSPIVSTDNVVFTKATMRVVRAIPVSSNTWSVPFAQFHFVGYVGTKEKTKSYFDIQTSVSQRVSD